MTGGTGERGGAGRGRLALIVPGISARGAAEFRRGGPGGVYREPRGGAAGAHPGGGRVSGRGGSRSDRSLAAAGGAGFGA